MRFWLRREPAGGAAGGQLGVTEAILCVPDRRRQLCAEGSHPGWTEHVSLPVTMRESRSQASP